VCPGGGSKGPLALAAALVAMLGCRSLFFVDQAGSGECEASVESELQRHPPPCERAGK
jgi:hypothetical protein